MIPEFRRSPDRNAALAQYRRRARFYDLELALFEPIRRRAIARLALKRGDTVLDVGCGTGLSLALLHAGVGAQGRIVGIEQSPEMIEQARRRVEQHAWRNVTLLCSAVEAADIAVRADAALFLFTHDILRSSEAIANVVAHLESGARVVASGLKWTRPALWPANLFVLGAALHSVTSLEGLSQPWNKLADMLDDWRVESLLAGAVYICSGVVAHNASVVGRAPA